MADTQGQYRGTTSRRRPALVVLGGLLIVVGALLAALVVRQVGNTVPVYIVTKPIPLGQQITESDVQVDQLSEAAATRLQAVTDKKTFVGKTASIELAPNTVLSTTFFGSSGVAGKNYVVGYQVNPTQAPVPLLKKGDHVWIFGKGLDGKQVSQSIGGSVVGVTENADGNSWNVQVQLEDNNNAGTAASLTEPRIVLRPAG